MLPSENSLYTVLTQLKQYNDRYSQMKFDVVDFFVWTGWAQCKGPTLPMWSFPLLRNIQLVKVAWVETPVVATICWMDKANFDVIYQFLKCESHHVKQFLGICVRNIWCPCVPAFIVMVMARWVNSICLQLIKVKLKCQEQGNLSYHLQNIFF